MSTSTHTQPAPTPSGDVEHHLTYLKLAFIETVAGRPGCLQQALIV